MPGPMRKGFSKPKDTKKTLLSLLSYIGRYRFRMLAALVMMMLSSVGIVIGTYLMKPIFNIATNMFLTGSSDYSEFIGYVILIGCVYALSVGLSYISQRFLLVISTNVLMNIRETTFAHLQKLPLKYYDERTHGEIMSRFSNDTDALRELIGNALPNIVSSSCTVIGILVMMIVLSWRLTILVLGIFALMLLVTQIIGKRSMSFFRKRQQALAKANGYIEEMIEGQREIKVFGHESKARADFDVITETLRDTSSKANAYSMVLMPIMGNLGYILFASTAVVGTSLIIADKTDIGTLAAFLQYSKQFGNPVTQISQLATNILNALAGAERIFNLIGMPAEVDDGVVTLERDGESWSWQYPDKGSVPLRGDVRFHDVSFSYDGEHEVLKHIELYAKPGQKLAFVGSTGAGKTTITNLLNRFYDVQEGSITYDGIDVKDIKKDDLRRSLAMVLQDTHLFTGSVMDNIRYGKLGATDEEVIAAAKRVNAHFFISHLPQGYETVLTADGANLSQGQRQLIAIARAIVADPPVLVLDEATSSIDTRTEALIEHGMDELMKGRTVFVIAHRLSTVRNSDAIIVLENGEIIERGNHDSLLKQRGKYYQLYMGMFELS